VNTRRAIVEAVAALLVEGDAGAVSVPAVADRSGVSVRTIYRYFPTKADLIAAVGVVDDPATTAGPLPALDGSDLHAWLRRGWSEEVQTPLLRAEILPTGFARIGVTQLFTELAGNPWPGSHQDHEVVLEVEEQLF